MFVNMFFDIEILALGTSQKNMLYMFCIVLYVFHTCLHMFTVFCMFYSFYMCYVLF